MNFPIYNSDYHYTLEEVYRYLKFFQNHIIHLSIYDDFFEDLSNKKAESTHRFKDDGLVIKLFWKVNIRLMHNTYINMTDLMKRHNKGDLSLIGYSIPEFSKEFKRFIQVPDKNVSDIYFNKVMKNRPKDNYSKEKYYQIEYECDRKPTIPDFFFDTMTEEIRNRIQFEEFYQKRKNKKE